MDHPEPIRPLLHHAAALTIRRLEAIPVAMPLRKPMKMAGSVVQAAENLVVRIEAADGTVGWGEAASAPTMTGDTRAAMVEAVRAHLAPALLGQDARDRAALARRLGRVLYGNTGARSAVEMALHDLVGRALGVSCTDLLGGALRDRVRPMWLLGNDRGEDDVAEALACTARGFSFFKLKVASKRLEADIETALELRRALGEHVVLCADANGGWGTAEALTFVEGAAGAGLLFLEQPLPPENMAGLARLCRGPVPIGADEGIHGLADLHAHAAVGVGGASLKPIKLGGAAAMLRAMAVCEQHDMRVNVAAKVSESGLGAAATVQLACLAGNADWGVSLTNVYLAEDILVAPLPQVEGGVGLPPGPGLGVEVDEAELARVTVR